MLRKTANVEGMELEVRTDWERYAPHLDRIANGVGPERWPEKMRKALDRLPYLLRPSRVHDVDYEVGGTEEERKVADRRFRRNALRCAVARLGPWYKRIWTSRGRREWAFAAALIQGAYRALRLGGKSAFNYNEVTR